MRDLLSQLFGGPRIDGRPLPSHSARLAWAVVNTRAQAVADVLGAKKSKKTILCRSCLLQAGTPSMGLFAVYTVDPRGCRSCANPATKLKQPQRTKPEENTRNSSQEETRVTLKARLRNLLELDQKKQTARSIELRSQELGEGNFIFSREAQMLAELDETALRSLFDDILRIKSDTAVEYFMATKHLIGDDSE